jgi:nucleoside-diphosphate-sugar epimerase
LVLQWNDPPIISAGDLGLLIACMNGAPIRLHGKGQRKQNYIDVRDVTTAVLSAIIKSDVSGMFLLGGHTISNLELAELCCKITKLHSPIEFSNIVDPHENYQWYIDDSHAKEQLGYIPQYTLTQSIIDIWESLQ